MALTGSMRDFGLSEILQLIGHQKKSGTLLVQDKNRKVEILFDQGGIVSARHEPPEDRFDLGAMLTRSGLISLAQLTAARKEERESLKPLEQILLSSRAVQLEELKEARSLAQLETIYSLFLWKEGDYSFEPGPVTYPQQYTNPISSEQVLMDGYRLKDEWPLIEKTIPDTRSKLRRVEGAGQAGRDQERVLHLIDGERTIEDVLFLARAGRFETLKTLRELIEAGQVEISGAAAAADTRDLGPIFFRAAVALIVLVGIVGAVLGAGRNLDRMQNRDLGHPGARAAVSLWALYRGDQVQRALTVHAATKGAYPARIEELVTEGELPPEALEGPGELKYEGGGEDYKLTLTPP